MSSSSSSSRPSGARSSMVCPLYSWRCGSMSKGLLVLLHSHLRPTPTSESLIASITSGDEFPMNFVRKAKTRIIHPSAWNRNSPKFTVASAADYSLASAERRGAWPQLVARRGDLAPCVTPLCSKRLRLATLQLPEKSLRYKSGAKPASRKVGGWYLAKDAPRRVVQAEGDPLLRRGAF